MSSEKRVLLGVFLDPIDLLVNNWPTPLLRLRSLSKSGYDVWAKLEFYNPFSRSIKDRPVWNMIRDAMGKGRVLKVLYEATSGNVGIAMASLSNIYGIKFRAYIPKPTPKTTEVLLKVLSAEVVSTDHQTIDQDMISMVSKLADMEGATNLNQYINDANYEVHLKYTAREIDEQLKAVGKKPDVIIAGIGTSGHIAALSTYFKDKYGDEVKVIGVQPSPGSSIPGIKRLETRPKWFFKVKVDEVIDVSRDEAVRESISIARSEGILIGLSSGAVTGAFKIIKDKYGLGTYVLIFPDDGFKYVEIFKEYIGGGS